MNKCVVLYIYFFNKSRFLCAFKNIKTIYISGILSLINFVLNPTPDRSCDLHFTWLLRHLFFGPCHWVRQSLKLNPSSRSVRPKVAEPLLWGCLEAGAKSQNLSSPKYKMFVQDKGHSYQPWQLLLDWQISPP